MTERNNQSLRQAAIQQLESLQAAGVTQIPKPRPGRRTAAAPAPSPSAEAASPQRSAKPEPPATPAIASVVRAEASAGGLFEPDQRDAAVTSRAATLEVLAQEVAGCTLCGELASTRTQTVFGVGNPRARLCFLGEAPGADEDRQGEPFVGRAGQLLNKIIEACRLRREDVYILNILKCRPPGNRNPAPDEAHNCRRYLDRQLELVSPEYICCLGAVAAQNLLATTEAIGKMRGKVLDYQAGALNVKVVCTYHPAYLLRNPSAKKYCWDDMKLLMREMGTPID
jgi:uracil-DNA glycosylase family 4